jgi:hypothetical protein
MQSTQFEIKLFAGCLAPPEMRMHMNLNKTTEDYGLQQVRYLGKDYLGYYLPATLISLEEAKKILKEVQGKLCRECPKLDVEDLHPCIFSQLFFG